MLFFGEKQNLGFILMLVPPRAHTPAGLSHWAGICHAGFIKRCSLHKTNQTKPGSSEHDPDFFYRGRKADNGASPTDWNRTLIFKKRF